MTIYRINKNLYGWYMCRYSLDGKIMYLRKNGEFLEGTGYGGGNEGYFNSRRFVIQIAKRVLGKKIKIVG